MKSSKRFVVRIAMVALLMLVLTVYAQEKKAKEVKVTGEIVDTACYIKMGAKGADHKECAEKCAASGIPLGILEDGTGNVYFLASKEDMESGNTLVKDFVANKVTITGVFAEKGGAKLLTINKVEKVK